MLLVIFPSSGNPIAQTNYAFLPDLAKKYMMMQLTEKCESCLISSLEKEASQFQLEGNPFALPKGLDKEASQFPLQFPFVPKKNFKRLELLNIGQSYGLDRLQSACIDRAMSSFKFQELATDPNYKKISLSNRERILEGMVRRTQEELKTKEQMIKSKDNQHSRANGNAVAAIQELENII